MEFKYFSNTLFILNGRSHVIFSLGFCSSKEFEFMEIRKQNESLRKSFYSLSFNFQKGFEFHSISHNNQTINQIYLFIITFQNLEFWDVTNLPPLKWISSSTFGEARKKKVRVWGLLKKIHRSSLGSRVLPPLETLLRFHQNSYTSSILLTVSVFSDLQDNSLSGLFR